MKNKLVNSRKKIDVFSLKRAAFGRDVVILGNGPSLTKMNFTELNDPVFIGVNGSAVFSSERNIVDDYYVLSDLRFVSDPLKVQLLKDNLSPYTVLVIRKELEEIVSRELPNRYCVVRSLGRDGFSSDLKKGYYFGCTTVMLALQLSSYISAGSVYLCGVDLRYDPEKPRFYKESTVHSVDNFACVQIHNIRRAYQELRKDGVELFNCSPYSLLRPYTPYYELQAS